MQENGIFKLRKCRFRFIIGNSVYKDSYACVAYVKKSKRKKMRIVMLKVEHLSYDVTEEGKTQSILKDVNFHVNDGEMLVITGPNGGGKSTIAKLLMGIYPATKGKILLDGQDLSNMSIDQRANAGIGFAFQQPPRFKGMTVERLLNLAAGEPLAGKRCCELLSNVGLCAQEYIHREIDATLSGGEMKRIEIASVLAKKHKICIFDEPEAGIDLWSFSMLVKEFEKIHKFAFDLASGTDHSDGRPNHGNPRWSGRNLWTEGRSA